MCKVGKRSARAIESLKKDGYSGRLFNLRDGIIGWSKEVDRNIAIY